MHSVIEVSGPGEVYIIDLGSASGTIVNGQRVNKARLESGDQLQFGNTVVVVELGAEAGDQPAAAATAAGGGYAQEQAYAQPPQAQQPQYTQPQYAQPQPPQPQAYAQPPQAQQPQYTQPQYAQTQPGYAQAQAYAQPQYAQPQYAARGVAQPMAMGG